MKSILTFFLILFNLNLYSQTDVKLVISENTINKIFDAIGPISGEGEYKIVQTKKFTWLLQGTHIDLIQDSALFITQAEVKTHLGTYYDEIKGKVSVSYNEKTNLISIQIIDAQFEVRGYNYGNTKKNNYDCSEYFHKVKIRRINFSNNFNLIYIL